MVQIADHLGVAELQAGWRESKDVTLARHYQVIWLLAEGRSCAEVARLTGFVRRWVEELAARYNRFGPSSLGDRRRGNGATPRIILSFSPAAIPSPGSRTGTTVIRSSTTLSGATTESRTPI